MHPQKTVALLRNYRSSDDKQHFPMGPFDLNLLRLSFSKTAILHLTFIHSNSQILEMIRCLWKHRVSIPFWLLEYEKGRLNVRWEHWTGWIVSFLYQDRINSVQIFPADTLPYKCTRMLVGHLSFCALFPTAAVKSAIDIGVTLRGATTSDYCGKCVKDQNAYASHKQTNQ
jgi:hypothetical protein